MPGVVAVVTGRDLAQWTTPMTVAPPIEGLRPVQIETYAQPHFLSTADEAPILGQMRDASLRIAKGYNARDF